MRYGFIFYELPFTKKKVKTSTSYESNILANK